MRIKLEPRKISKSYPGGWINTTAGPEGVHLGVVRSTELRFQTRDKADEFLTELQNLLVEYTDQDLEVIEDSEVMEEGYHAHL